ncbi:tRNA uridine-5-carboxymethylaminomethyl(34) synthesis GTPase MnmE [Aliikangiella coralliicola]|uniref:tRNA modification GTPase MnmE n=1 Tax=Aliikangiella coralliicola TaxID=2592383 RepID=A0A545UGK8_9GAMM|nr:tRNA uridine-5-carboxymethylaminomethyl(34) synthesis GTPase MnmE [Aliikangiella coralliicola]TQV88597.1 tRNA uridine-5-carboxymethylaminomethyl(34) synthesis GTPase MnmE [Aliikangiella coralliicola]
MTEPHQSTIVALATPPGKGGVSIVRVSGPLCHDIAQKLLGQSIKPRYAHYLPFRDLTGQQLDQGIALFFDGPNSFTGEDVLEFQGHGGPVVMDLLIETILSCGAQLAKPGEFSERAFFNDKLDLAQAEAIADLIDSGSRQAAKSALRSLTGEFSQQINQLVEKVIYLRMYVEAAIDFPDEEIDFLADDKVTLQLDEIVKELKQLLSSAHQGSLLREGMKVVIAGKPNAGKSSLLNALSGKESAIVTDIAGTTRDVLSEQINIDGLPLHIIDTAGLRQARDKVEQIGIERASKEIEQADRILLVVDSSDGEVHLAQQEIRQFIDSEVELPPVTLIRNKCDVTNEVAGIATENSETVITLSAKKRLGLALLKSHLKQSVGFEASESGTFMARRRHIDALTRASHHLQTGYAQLVEMAAGEILAEELKLTQNCLNEITGEFSSDDLLGKIFSSFCIGK